MVTIYDYEDYREYLSDYYKKKKAQNPNFSYQVFSNMAKFKNKSFFHLVISGKKNLGNTSIYKISQAIGHSKKEEEYFQNLVCYNQAKTLKEQNHFLDRLKGVKNSGKQFSKARLLREDQFEYISKWYHAVIRSLINQFGYENDYTWLSRTLDPPILPKEAKKSVELLERLGLIKKQRNGKYIVSDKTISTGKEAHSHAALNFHVDMIKHALNAAEYQTKNKRFLTGLTLGISQKTYNLICNKLQDFSAEILDIAKNDDDSDCVFQVNFQMFPVTKTHIKRRI